VPSNISLSPRRQFVIKRSRHAARAANTNHIALNERISDSRAASRRRGVKLDLQVVRGRVTRNRRNYNFHGDFFRVERARTDVKIAGRVIRVIRGSSFCQEPRLRFALSVRCERTPVYGRCSAAGGIIPHAAENGTSSFNPEPAATVASLATPSPLAPG